MTGLGKLLESNSPGVFQQQSGHTRMPLPSKDLRPSLKPSPPSATSVLHFSEPGIMADYPEGPTKAGAKKPEGSSPLSVEPLAFSLAQQSLESSFIHRYRECWPFLADELPCKGGLFLGQGHASSCTPLPEPPNKLSRPICKRM